MTIRPATAGDLAAIAELQGDFGWDSRHYLDYDCRVAIVDRKIAGFLVSRETAPGEREVLNIAVAPEFRRQGVGRSLVADELGRSRGTWFLEVRESNDAAIKLYESLGFRAMGRRPDYYIHPIEAAIVMRFFS